MAVTFTRQSPTWEDGHTVYAEDAERWEQLGADVDAWSDQVDAGRNYVPGTWGLPGQAWFTSHSADSVPADTLVGNAFELGAPATLDGLSCRVVTAITGNAYLGLYRHNGTTWARVADAGTVSTATTGIKSVTGLGVALVPGVYAATVLPSAATAFRCLRSTTTPGGFSQNAFPDDRPVPRDLRNSQAYSGGLPTTAALSPYLDEAVVWNRVAVRLT